MTERAGILSQILNPFLFYLFFVKISFYFFIFYLRVFWASSLKWVSAGNFPNFLLFSADLFELGLWLLSKKESLSYESSLAGSRQ